MCAKDRADLIAVREGKIIGSKSAVLGSGDAVSLSEVLQSFCRELGVEQTMVTLLMSPGSYQVLMVESPPVPPEELAQALRWKVKDLVAASIEDSIVDGFALPDDAYRGRQKMVYAVTTEKSTLQQQVDQIGDIGFEVDRISLPELIVSELIANELHEGQAEIVLMIGRQRSFLSVYADGAIYFSRKLDICETDLSSIVEGDAANSPALDGFILELQRSRDYFESQLGKGVVSRIILVQTEASAESLVALIKDSLQLNVDVSDSSIDTEHFSLAGAEPLMLASCALAAA